MRDLCAIERKRNNGKLLAFDIAFRTVKRVFSER